MVAAAELDEVVELRFAGVGPGREVTSVAEPQAAAGELAAAVAVGEGAPKRRRDGPSSAPDVKDRAVGGVTHHDDDGVAGDPAGRFRGNA